MDLFHQTISMKSVGNLTDFVREHMLEAFPVQDRIDALVAHYQDLDRAHELVLKAKFQLGFLMPLVEDCDRRARRWRRKSMSCAPAAMRCGRGFRVEEEGAARKREWRISTHSWKSWPTASWRPKKRAPGAAASAMA